MAKLIIDLPKCRQQDASEVQCSYKYHPENKGFDAVLESVCFALICRKCEAAPCVTACPQDALEKVPAEDGQESVLKRASMRCSGCGSCAIACPFGTIYTDQMTFTTSICDLCRDRLGEGEKPLCVQTGDGALEYGEVAVEGDLVEVFDDVVVRVPQGTLWEPFLRETERS